MVVDEMVHDQMIFHEIPSYEPYFVDVPMGLSPLHGRQGSEWARRGGL